MLWIVYKKFLSLDAVKACASVKLGRVELLMKLHLRTVGCHLPYRITQCYLPQVNNSALTPAIGRYSIYLPQRDGRLSGPR